MQDITRNLSSRRDLLSMTGKTLSLAAVSLVIGREIKTASAADLSQDIAILNAAIALEHEGIAAYQIAATSGLLQPAIVDIGVAFQGHHKGHRDILVKAVETLGGTPAIEKSLEEYARNIKAETLKNQTDVLRLALDLERGAANAYLGLIPSLGNDFHQIAAQMAADESFHAAILANALGEPIPKAALLFG